MNFPKQLSIVFIILVGCNTHDLPKEQYAHFETHVKIYAENDTLYFSIENDLKCPLRYYFNSEDSVVNDRLSEFKPLTLQAMKDTVLIIAGDSNDVKKITFYAILGDANKKISKYKMSLPFPSRSNYRVVQGYSGVTHADDFQRCAIDFGLSQNDTVCAADDGFVIGIVKDYKYGGGDKQWKDYANYITLYHSRSGLFTQYVHLAHLGNLVAVGDTVKRGQPIGLSGLTGWTDIEHLHFNVFEATFTAEGWKSVAVEFEEGYKGNELKRDDVVVK